MRTRTIALLFLAFFLPTLAYPQNQAPSQPPAPPPGARIKISSDVAAAQLIQQTPPVYPAIAKTAHISGTVVLHEIIAKDGTVKSVDYVSGPILLQQAAMDAVQQWRYKPLLIDGEPVEVDTTASIVFSLADGPAVTPQAPIDPQFKQDVMALLEVMNYRDTATKAIKSALDSNRVEIENTFPDTPNKDKIVAEYQDKLVALAQSPEFMDKLIGVYAKYLSDEDVKNLTQFYESPTGKRFSDAEIDLMNDLGQAGVELGQEKIGGILSDICNEYPELQGKARVCSVIGKGPASDAGP